MNSTKAPVTSFREARGQFAAMASAYFMGTFNDNLYKKAVMILAVVGGSTAVQSLAAALYTLPFVILAAPAGWLADRFPKRKVVIGAKGLELLAAILGGWAVCSGHLLFAALMLGLMGVQAAVFSPALNGSIPELFPATQVTKANGILRTVVTVGIVGGTALAGFVLANKAPGWHGLPMGKLWLLIIVVGMAILGLGVSFWIPEHPAADPTRSFPWSGPLDTLRTLREMREDALLFLVMLADAFLWSLGVIQLLLVDTLSLTQFGLGEKTNGLLSASQLLGIAAGALLAGYFAQGKRWYRVLPIACVIMAVAMVSVGLVPWLPGTILKPVLYVLLFIAGTGAGLFIIPCESFIQIRPAAAIKGAVWASANFVAFLGMSVAAGCAWGLNQYFAPTTSFALLGLLVLLMAGLLARALRRFQHE